MPFPIQVPVDPVSDPIETISPDAIEIVLPTIRRLANEHKTVLLGYRGEEREVEPYREWVSSGGGLMLTAWCRKAGSVRTFSLSQVTSAREGQPFDPRGDILIPKPDPEPDATAPR